MEIENSVVRNEDWEVECSDEEKYEINSDAIIKVFNLLNEGKFEFDCKLTRKEIKTSDCDQENKDSEVKHDSPVKANDKLLEVTTQKEMSIAEEFAFDIMNESEEILVPRRSLAKTPRTTEKKVAQWDKIMNDFIKTQKLEEKQDPKSQS